MKTFYIELARTEYLSQAFTIEAENETEAIEKAWDRSGKWKCVEADEFVNYLNNLDAE